MLVKAIEAKSKAAFQLSTSISNIDVYYQKKCKLDKREEFFKSFKKEQKSKPAESQPFIMFENGLQSSSRNLQRT